MLEVSSHAIRPWIISLPFSVYTVAMEWRLTIACHLIFITLITGRQLAKIIINDHGQRRSMRTERKIVAVVMWHEMSKWNWNSRLGSRRQKTDCAEDFSSFCARDRCSSELDRHEKFHQLKKFSSLWDNSSIFQTSFQWQTPDSLEAVGAREMRNAEIVSSYM